MVVTRPGLYWACQCHADAECRKQDHVLVCACPSATSLHGCCHSTISSDRCEQTHTCKLMTD